MENKVYSDSAASPTPFWARLAIAVVLAVGIAIPLGNVAWVAVGQVQFGQLLRLVDLTELHPGGGLIALGLLLAAAVFGVICAVSLFAALRILFDPLFSAPVDLAETQPTE